MYGCLIPLIQMGRAEIMRPMRNKWEETRTISKPNTENVTATGNTMNYTDANEGKVGGEKIYNQHWNYN